MYATVRTYTAGPELADALVSNEADVKTLISGIDGFNAYYLVRTAEGAVSISVYDSEAGVNESTSAAANSCACLARNCAPTRMRWAASSRWRPERSCKKVWAKCRR